ncbi:beta-lactamase family protein [Streptomyces sp. NBC_01142]|uniref:serine hydrolase domain-containing protein n=1 Tax=Streptomyces sp. NBC_01142 TaxID=2975865 RepID=UPI00225614D5|nr:serine hydrolase domain-containing protein [Streptomyces sp. NBC_01142]MCX4823097.1 beta-lactamase family protein [Streptomyces sp. NBC_01142]
MSVRRVRTALIAAVAVVAAATTVLVNPAAADVGTDSDHHPAQQAIEAAVRDGVPGVVAQARDRRGTWNGTAGVADLRTGRERLPQDRYRVGSITKTFVATVLLQLEAEGGLHLDDTVEDWLPGVVRGHGHDGRRITLRQLLNHTSGIYNYTVDPGFRAKVFGDGFFQHRYDTWRPRQLVALAMRHRPDFAPGTEWKYSNTNFILAGMVVEKATGSPYGREIERRILRPLGLRATSLPGTDARMPRPSGRAYSTLSEDPEAKIHDVTELNASAAWAAGEMISDNADLQRFYRALMKGALLPRQQLKEMTTTVAMDPQSPDNRYGLGLLRVKLSCGKDVWGHGGGIHGSSSGAMTTRDASHSLALNFNGDWSGDTWSVVEAEFCGQRGRTTT